MKWATCPGTLKSEYSFGIGLHAALPDPDAIGQGELVQTEILPFVQAAHLFLYHQAEFLDEGIMRYWVFDIRLTTEGPHSK